MSSFVSCRFFQRIASAFYALIFVPLFTFWLSFVVLSFVKKLHVLLPYMYLKHIFAFLFKGKYLYFFYLTLRVCLALHITLALSIECLNMDTIVFSVQFLIWFP